MERIESDNLFFQQFTELMVKRVENAEKEMRNSAEYGKMEGELQDVVKEILESLPEEKRYLAAILEKSMEQLWNMGRIYYYRCGFFDLTRLFDIISRYGENN